MEVIHTSALSKTYGSKNAVDHMDMIVPQGAIYGFIGRNGAGKSTTQKMICGLVKPTSGNIQLFEKPVEDKAARHRVGMLIENAGLHPELSAHENLVLQGLCIGINDAEKRASESLEMVGLAQTGKKPTKQFSMGMKQRLGIAMALLGDPELLVLDEPINGLDPEGIREIRQILTRLNQEKGMTILISSHILGELSKISTHYGIIKDGHMVQQISAKQLADNCRDYLHIKVKEPNKAAELLTQTMGLSGCDAYPEDELRIYGVTDTGPISQALAAGGFAVQEMYLHQQDLEEYFLDLMGGGSNG